MKIKKDYLDPENQTTKQFAERVGRGLGGALKHWLGMDTSVGCALKHHMPEILGHLNKNWE